ncbi:MAG: hypothetical protein NZO16_03660, partial [Deltaproteobacteria bacterium]|nr:hypothetical protein [Deltaproteobacteria bacterium]
MIRFRDYSAREVLVWFFVFFVAGSAVFFLAFNWGKRVALNSVFEAKLASANLHSPSAVAENVTQIKLEPLKSGWYVLVTMDKDLDTIVKLRDLLIQNGFA